VIRQARVPESEVISLDEVSRMGNHRHGEGNRFSESSCRAERERLVGINYRKVQPSKIQLFPRVCALAFEIASLKYENYCPWLRSVSLATCITSVFLIFQASFLSTAGIQRIGIAITRARENLFAVAPPWSRMRAPRAPFVLIFYRT